jgi:tetratricopeptide (TPR) repeat protein
LLAHTEGAYDVLTARECKIGKQQATDYSVQTTETDFLNVAKQDELTAHLDSAYSDYQRGLEKFSESSALLKGAGRLSILLNRFQEAADRLERAGAKSAEDPEILYYLGVAYTNLGSEDKAHAAFSAVANDSPFARAANIQMAAALSRAGNWGDGLKIIRTLPGFSPDQTAAGAMEVAFLRHLGRLDEAKSRLKYWQASDPSDLLLRFEAFRLGVNNPAFFRQLAADPERVLNIASHLFDLGFFDDSLTITDRKYPAADPLDVEPGAVPPQDYPLVAYYRAYARERLGPPASTEDYRAASQLSILYVFPNRPGSLRILQAALKQNPDDATAHALLGSLYFDFRMTDEAIAEWQKARALRKDLPGLQRNLGRALLEIKMDAPAAAEVLKEGLTIDPTNLEVAEALQKAQSASSKLPAAK